MNGSFSHDYGVQAKRIGLDSAKRHSGVYDEMLSGRLGRGREKAYLYAFAAHKVTVHKVANVCIKWRILNDIIITYIHFSPSIQCPPLFLSEVLRKGMPKNCAKVPLQPQSRI